MRHGWERRLARGGALARGCAPLILGLTVFVGCGGTRATGGQSPLPLAEAGVKVREGGAIDRCSPGDVDVLDHTVDLSLALDPPKLTASGEIRVRAARATDVIALDAVGLRVLEVMAPSGAIPFRQSEGHLCAVLDTPLEAGREIALRMRWEVPTSGEIPAFRPGEAWAGYRASAWMPTRQDSRARATLHLGATVDAGVKFVASGDRSAITPLPNGKIRHDFVLDRPSPPFLYAFAAGRYDESMTTVGDVALRALGPSGTTPSRLSRALDVTAAMLRLLSARTGAPLPSKEYVQVFVAGDMQQEAAGMALLSAESLDDLARDLEDDWLFSHELAHQWFAWLVSCEDFGDFWLNEGFATFLVAVLKKEMHGQASYDAEIARWRERSRKVHAEGRDAPIAPRPREGAPRKEIRDSDLPPRGVTYFRGALVLQKLEKELGERAFWDGVKRYVHDRAGKGARTEHLRAALEAASGRDLKAFFDRWVYTAAPDL